MRWRGLGLNSWTQYGIWSKISDLKLAPNLGGVISLYFFFLVSFLSGRFTVTTRIFLSGGDSAVYGLHSHGYTCMAQSSGSGIVVLSTSCKNLKKHPYVLASFPPLPTFLSCWTLRILDTFFPESCLGRFCGFDRKYRGADTASDSSSESEA